MYSVIGMFLALLATVMPAYGMENSESIKPRVVIIDRNSNQRLQLPTPSLIALFGATPRYTVFNHYIQTLQAHSDQMVTAVSRHKRLRHVSKSIKKFIEDIKHGPGLHRLTEHAKSSSLHDQLNLFFAAGFNAATMQENVATLYTTVDRELQRLSKTLENPVTSCLAHIFVPSYFMESPELASDTNTLHTFLCSAAQFYKRLYESVPTAGSNALPVYIIIPKIEAFTAVMHAKECNKVVANLGVVQENLMASANDRFVLIDQNKDDLKAMVGYLQVQGLEGVESVHLSILDTMQKPITIFNSYLIRPEHKALLYGDSPLFNDTLKTFIQQQRATHE